MTTIFRHWKGIYLVCSLVYVGWTIHVGDSEFKKINRQYRSLVNQLEPERVKTVALKELADEHRRGVGEQSTPQDGIRYKPTSEEVEVKIQKVDKRLAEARKRGFIKMVLFYTSFMVFFLILPPLVIYLFVLGIVTLGRSITLDE